jgi:serine/threonine protein kinase
VQGEYQLLDIIGKGAFGCAYKARHLPTGRLVCIKTMDVPQVGHNQEEQLVRQKREVAVLATLALHPNIIRCVGQCAWGNMQFLQGPAFR